VGCGHSFEDSPDFKAPDLALARGGLSETQDRYAFPAMGLADDFQRITDSLPDDWTDLELDLRLVDESRYVEAAVYLVACNARPYSHHDWHWRLLVAHRFGHAASAPTVHGTLKLLDDAGIEGEMVVRELRSGRAEIMEGWGRPQSAREEFQRLRAL
jgi:hypothetical protein